MLSAATPNEPEPGARQEQRGASHACAGVRCRVEPGLTRGSVRGVGPSEERDYSSGPVARPSAGDTKKGPSDVSEGPFLVVIDFR